MLKMSVSRLAPVAILLSMSACTWLQQPAAPVIAGGDNSVYTPSVVNNGASTNPYGATPYNPNAGNTATVAAPYTPPVATYTPPAVSTSGGYVPSYAPVDINAATHTVVRGDTVYNIAKRYQITQDNLRAWNGLADNTISVGQVLRVKPAGYVAPATTVAATKPTTPVQTQQPAAKPVQQAASTPVQSGGTRNVAGITWQRPTSGNVVGQFGGNNKGIDIAGNAGQAVVSAADGKVVYAGSGLRGYGNLVIVQHNSTFLTAYGHNQSLLVKEGQTVKRGQTIARMGNTDAPRNQLHFEVRQNGKPVNPTQYIPL